ncbi:MAG TPA: universal stress protein [Blastocatellia bacterium]|jgi:nucleotide-binding universal stress UspA family protein|nr:universal stress protein [Blastocatellia bacterium]
MLRNGGQTLVTSNERIIFERILCPMDLTPGSDECLRYGIALAKAYDAKLFVINCSDLDAAAAPGRRAQIRRRIDTAVQKYFRLPATQSFSCDVILVDGDPKEAISQHAAEYRIDLIVMRSRRRPYAAALLGSTAEAVCRTAPCPVLVTHPREQEWAGMTTNEIGLQRVLVAYDFSSDSELALSYGLSLAQECQAELHLLHVLPVRSSRPDAPEIAFMPLADDGFREASRGLHNAVPHETRLWCQVKQAVREGQPYREVLSYADEHDIDLICMGASGTGFGMRALFGSNADRVLRQTPCPLLIARPLKPAVARLLV